MKKSLREKDGMTISNAHNNPILDTRMYKVEYNNGHNYSLAANTMVENMLDQVSKEGNLQVLFRDIFDRKCNDTEVKEQDALIMICTGTKCFRDTKKGVEVLVQWKDGAETLGDPYHKQVPLPSIPAYCAREATT